MKTCFKPVLALSLLLLAGCEMTTPSQVQVRPMEVRKIVKTETIDLAHPDATRAEILAGDYKHNGNGPVSLTVSYMSSDAAHAAAVHRNGAVWRGLLAKSGMPDVTVSYVAVNDPAFAGRAVATWSAMSASPPAGCGRIPGHEGADGPDQMEKYVIGCETQTMMSRQIARPADLLGRAGVSSNDSVRDATLVDKYRAGTPNPKMDGMNASTISNSGGGG